MIVPFLLVAMVALLLLHGWVLPRRLARDVGARSDATGWRLPPSGHGFDTRHETSAHWT